MDKASKNPRKKINAKEEKVPWGTKEEGISKKVVRSGRQKPITKKRKSIFFSKEKVLRKHGTVPKIRPTKKVIVKKE